ncbi:restriction endonuclease subunit S [Mesoflavibacter zeaxanthinifaciens]|uniref:restriction endonuclease subunit S n=1 Tax=Mesoflavibacter zeaxanthinifaciens TaxID=393060 RepID=UPI003A943B19
MEKQLIPQLRFSEFNQDWQSRPFKELTKINQGLQIPISERYLEQVEDSYFYITNEFLKEGSKNTYFIKNPSKSVLCNEDDILMTRTGNTGMVVTNVSGAFHNNFFRIAYPDYINKSFLYYFLTLDLTQSYIKRLAGTSTIPDLNHSDFYRIKMNYPKLEEQQKIASFISDLDLIITKLTKKKNLLEQYKKGIMQKIFNQELRFKDDNGNNFSDWEEKKLGEIGSIVNGLTYSPNDIDENGVLVLRSSNVKKRLIALSDNVFVNVEEGKFNPVELNDILICVRNGSKRLIGKNAIIKEEHIGLAFGAFMTVYRSNYNRFLFHFFDSQHYKKEVHKNLGATINSINGGDLKKFKVPFPCLKEQTKIANFLSDIDLKIEVLNTKIENSKSFKKGVLQQMFV